MLQSDGLLIVDDAFADCTESNSRLQQLKSFRSRWPVSGVSQYLATLGLFVGLAQRAIWVRFCALKDAALSALAGRTRLT